MEKFIRHTGIGAPLRRSAVDTDQIIPAVYLKRITRTGFDDALFAAWRANEADFVLNREAYRRASILVAGPDFGTGSSREHAVWALKDYGFKVVLAPRFADIFRGNAGKQGLVAGVISQDDAEQLWKILETEPGTQITVDLRERSVVAGGMRTTFQIDDYVRWTLMEGLDDISLTLQHEDEIVAYERARPSFKPAALPARHLPEEEVVPARAADIFRGNAGKQGLVAGVISQDDAEQLWKILETEPGTQITVDLRERSVVAGGMRTTFQIDDYVRWTLMEGLDDISLTLQHEDEIVAYERARPSFKPAALPARHLPEEEVVPARAADMPVVARPSGAGG